MSIDKLQGSVPSSAPWTSGSPAIFERMSSALSSREHPRSTTAHCGCIPRRVRSETPAVTISRWSSSKSLKANTETSTRLYSYYRLDDVKEVGNPDTWQKAQPNLGMTVTYDTYARDVERAENVPSVRNDILAKRFGLPMEGYTYFFNLRRDDSS